MTDRTYAIPRAASPEEVGVSSAAIAGFIRDCEENGIENHSFMVIRHGKVAYEAWRKPYSADIPHTMYSVSKSIIAIAAGFAVSEGLITTDTRLVDVFPEYRPEKPDEALEAITLHSLMTMTAGKNVSLLADKTSKHWVRDFVETKQSYFPGKSWSYISENTYCVAAMLSRLSGMTVTEYLKPRLYEPLGITSHQWERDTSGIEVGGWGLFLKTEDLAKIALCCLNGGKFNGKQIIPREWIALAASNHTEGIENSPEAGYGYFIWRCDCDESTYRFDGMFSQFAIMFEKYDAVVVMTDNEINEAKTLACFWQHFPEAFFDGEAPKAVDIPAFSVLDEVKLGTRQTDLEEHISQKTIKLSNNPIVSLSGYPLSVLTFPAVYMSADKAGPMDNIKLKFYEDECTMYWTEGDESNIIHIGLDGIPRKSRITLGKLKYTTSSTAAWLDKNVLEIRIRPLETVCQRVLRFTFKGNSVTLEPSSMPHLSYLSEELEPTVQNMMSGQAPHAMIRLVFLNAYKLLDAAHHGKLI
ncbi:MAG: serine hydrolase [Clostridia bacterium]|nr:serine hydrolase [Clostridia bacterium]